MNVANEDKKDKLPRMGGSFTRHPDTGELHPNLDDHVMVHRVAQEAAAQEAAGKKEPAPAPSAAPAPAPSQKTANKGGDQ